LPELSDEFAGNSQDRFIFIDKTYGCGLFLNCTCGFFDGWIGMVFRDHFYPRVYPQLGTAFCGLGVYAAPVKKAFIRNGAGSLRARQAASIPAPDPEL